MKPTRADERICAGVDTVKMSIHFVPLDEFIGAHFRVNFTQVNLMIDFVVKDGRLNSEMIYQLETIAKKAFFEATR